MKTIRLCFAGNMLGRNPGYVTTQGQIVADLFAAANYEVTVVSSKINRAARIAEIILTLIKKRRDLDLVVLEVYSGLSFSIATVVGRLCQFLRLPLVMVLHGGGLPEFVRNYPRWTRRVLSRANLLVAPSRFMAREIGCLGFEIPVIPNVIELEQYEFRERRQIAPKLIWMRSFHEIYNPQMAVKVLAKLRQKYPDAVLTIAGNDKGIEAATKKLAADLNLTDCIRFPGFLNDEQKCREFAAADIYLNTNRIDNMPVSVVEAMAFGLPVVATNVGGLSALIENGTNGLLVESDNVAEMAAAIKSLLENPQLTNRLSINGRQLAERSAWANVCTQWEQAFDLVLRQTTAKEINFSTLKLTPKSRLAK